MDILEFESAKRYVGFDIDGALLLRGLYTSAEDSLGELSEDFYDAIRRHEAAAVVITGGEAQVRHLKRTLVDWVHALLLGPYDESYLATRSRIGSVHVRIGLPQALMFTAMNRIRVGLLTLCAERVDSERQLATERAIKKGVDCARITRPRRGRCSGVRSTARKLAVGRSDRGSEARERHGVLPDSSVDRFASPWPR